ncbi:NAD(P)-binding protein [Aspergillus sclerotioniger CBS 115572]|uniref:NAD(P)-binding protein n=1 Tax=Aspergillus sclerotioniger CBS 115572 TaxID=1450535 RepID=A0A317WPD5_9EURO|nr:NAD(P)-binding protein [Aspergillus sclerotioniger CBS 115572]PWY87122.1 NAD(P)-binding protein [Aspergillus sclerotioniger CBS 115572]
MAKIAIIGLGSVGASTALSLIHQRVQATLLLVDTNSTLRDAQAITQVRASTHREASQADVVVITAGAKYTPGETSIQHLYQKISILKSILTETNPFNPNTILIIVANPVDLLTTLAQDISGLSRPKVFGIGTCLESARLRDEVSRLSGRRVDGYVVGVKGEYWCEEAD